MAPRSAPDFEIVVSDLQPPVTGPVAPAEEQSPAPLTTPVQQSDADALASPETSALLAGRSPLALRPRVVRRRARATLTIGLTVTLALCALLVISLPNPQMVRVLLHLPMPTAQPTLLPGADQLYVTRGVYWGNLTVDGRTITTKTLNTGPVSLTRGSHQIVYRARFFPPLYCRLSVPAEKTDTCPLIPQAQLDTPNPTFGRARILDLRATANRLPAAQYQGLLNALNQTLAKLAQSGVLAPGEHYTTANGRTAVSSVPLKATLLPSIPSSRHVYQPDKPGSMQYEDACDPVCDFQGSFGVLLQNWQLATYLYTAWRFITPHGQAITPPPRALSQGERILPFFAWWTDQDGTIRWHVSVSSLIVADVECAQGQQQLAELAVQANVSGVSLEPLTQLDVTKGCLLLYQPPSQTQPLSAAAQVIYHYGVLLAANGVARQLFPMLPLANASEVATASQLFAQA